MNDLFKETSPVNWGLTNAVVMIKSLLAALSSIFCTTESMQSCRERLRGSRLRQHTSVLINSSLKTARTIGRYSEYTDS